MNTKVDSLSNSVDMEPVEYNFFHMRKSFLSLSWLRLHPSLPGSDAAETKPRCVSFRAHIVSWFHLLAAPQSSSYSSSRDIWPGEWEYTICHGIRYVWTYGPGTTWR